MRHAASVTHHTLNPLNIREYVAVEIWTDPPNGFARVRLKLKEEKVQKRYVAFIFCNVYRESMTAWQYHLRIQNISENPRKLC